MLFDKTAADLQENVVISGRNISGTCKKIADWSSAGFDPANGTHFIAVHFKTNTSGATIKAECVPTQGTPTPSFTDDDAIMQITENTTGIKVTETVDDTSVSKIYPLNVELED